jgi:hypothetical protein
MASRTWDGIFRRWPAQLARLGLYTGPDRGRGGIAVDQIVLHERRWRS